MKWRAFIGEWEQPWDGPLIYQRATRDEHGLTWEQARQVLREYVQPFLTDEFDDCRQHATEIMASLDGLTPGGHFIAELEAELLLLMLDDDEATPAPSPTAQD